MVDHIAGGVLAWTTLRNVAIADATEVFVFLAGVVTAIAYGRLASTKGVAAADGRFKRRAWEIYRAFLLLAALMFMAGGLLLFLNLQTPSLENSQVRDFIASPLLAVYQVVTLQRQPFLSDILPMYAFFALLAPLAIRLARRSWMWLLVASAALWLAAPWLGAQLPSTRPNWMFNPFAWQAVFVLGLIAGMYPEIARRPGPVASRVLTVAACVVFVAGAIFSLFSYHEGLRAMFLSSWFEHGLGTFSKSNASAVRIINFLAIAWLMYGIVQRGWLRGLFARLRWIALVGKHGLLCFMGGAVISILAEALSYALSGGQPVWHYALLADVTGVAALIGLAVWREHVAVRQRQAAVPVVAALRDAAAPRIPRHDSP